MLSAGYVTIYRMIDHLDIIRLGVDLTIARRE